MNLKRLLLYLLGSAVLIFVLLQFIPVDKENPPVLAEPNWDSAQTRDLAKAACFDCHSNETVWPWYANIAPPKLLLAHDVEEGRQKINFSEWGRGDYELEEIAEVIQEGEMPPWYYVIMHSDANLTDAEKDQLIAGLHTTIGVGFEESEDEEHEEEDDD